MKKLLAILLLSVASIFSPVFPQDITGDGTEGNPYILYNAADLDSIRILGLDDKWYALGNDIDMTSWGPWLGIENWGCHLHGRGYTISNLILTEVVDAGNSYWGFIANSQSTTHTADGVRGLTLRHVRVLEDSLTNTDNYVGALFANTDGPKGVIDSCAVIDFVDTFKVKNSQVANIGGLIGKSGFLGSGSSGTWFITQCYVQDINLTFIGAGSGGLTMGGLIGFPRDNVAYHVEINRCWAENITLKTNKGSGIYVGGLVGYHICDINDSYVMNVSLETPSTSTTAMLVGPFSGYTTSDKIERCYVVTNSFISGIHDTLEAGFIGTAWSVASHDTSVVWCKDSTTSRYDMTATNGANPWNFSGVWDSSCGRTTAWMKDSLNFKAKGWTFNNQIWKIHPTVNYGFPNLVTSEGYIAPILTYPNDAAYVFREDSIITVTWSIGTDTSATLQVLSYSLDNGSTWTLIDTVLEADVAYQWTIPRATTTQGKVKIFNNGVYLPYNVDSSDVSFTILPHSSLDILYPTEVSGQTFQIGDTAHVIIESIFVDDFLFYFSKDSINWEFVDNVVVDTTNGFYQDTTTYIWTFDSRVSGPIIYGRVTEYGDTSVYVWNETPLQMNFGYPLGFAICQYDISGGFLEHKTKWDPSCQWSSPPHTYYTRYLPDDGMGPAWDWYSEVCDWPYEGCQYPSKSPVYLTYPADTLAVAMENFYSSPAATLTYWGREYYLDTSDSTLRCNDLVNNIDSLFVADLTTAFAGVYGWNPAEVIMQIYNVQWSKLSGEYIPNDTTFENLNDAWFSPRIIIGVPSILYRVWTVTALPFPIDQNFDQDDELLYIDVRFERHFFRGIHPKAEKR